jgi:hypothetical protein
MTSIRRLSADSAAGRSTREEDLASRQRREVFGDCALIEIIHLHDCLRGAVKTLKADVQTLAQCLLNPTTTTLTSDDDGGGPTKDSVVADLEGRVFGRFQVIWSVFRAHSSAEDEFIWPALRRKTQPAAPASTSTTIPLDDEEEEDDASPSAGTAASSPAPESSGSNRSNSSSGRARQAPDNLVQEEYEEDHADEERMFSEMDSLLGRLKEGLNQDKAAAAGGTNNSSSSLAERPSSLANRIMEQTQRLSNHLLKHLEKEELHCMPLVLQHLDKAEIHDLVGQIMGRRSADTITNIMTMAVQSLDTEEREEMIKYMKQSMQNTFFDQWLLASGWGSSSPAGTEDGAVAAAAAPASSEGASSSQHVTTEPRPEDRKRSSLPSANLGDNSPVSEKRARVAITTQAELERLIRAIATNQSLSTHQKNTTIQGLRDSVWKQNQQVKQRQRQNGSPLAVAVNVPLPEGLPLLSQTSAAAATPTSSVRLATVGPTVQSCSLPPAKYFKKNEEGSLKMVWSSDAPTSNPLPADGSVPTFSASELAPTFHDGVAGAVFGCPHYSRACKLRHPKSGRLYTCRLCCDHQRELPMREDEPLDRYAVTEVMCMKCTAVQPASDRCINPDCESSHKSFARYFCRICHLYDDGSRPIFHCPYCNTCRLGHGLGIDYRHCMRCNACVSLSDKEHRCIPQKLQGDCPICHEALFQSTEPLRGVKCGHVMHLSCFTQYRRNRYTCPLCCKSMEDMKDHFAMLDAAIRMQPMPVTFLNTMSSIYCQDCGKTGQVPYHFVGMKCQTCSSYNTREMGRVQN